MPKKSNIISINLNSKSLICLQVAGYLNGLKKTTGKNVSRFFNKLILDYYDVQKADFRLEVRKKELLNLLNHKQKERDILEKDISIIASELINVKEQLNNKVV